MSEIQFTSSVEYQLDIVSFGKRSEGARISSAHPRGASGKISGIGSNRIGKTTTLTPVGQRSSAVVNDFDSH